MSGWDLTLIYIDGTSHTWRAESVQFDEALRELRVEWSSGPAVGIKMEAVGTTRDRCVAP